MVMLILIMWTCNFWSVSLKDRTLGGCKRSLHMRNIQQLLAPSAIRPWAQRIGAPYIKSK